MTFIPEEQALLIERKPFFEATFSFSNRKFSNLLIATDSKKIINLLTAYKPEIVLLKAVLNQDSNNTKQLSKNSTFFSIPITLTNNPKIYKAVLKAYPIAYLSTTVTRETIKQLIQIGQMKINRLSTSTPPVSSQSVVLGIEEEIFVKTGSILKKVLLKDIEWFGVGGKYAYVKTEEKQLPLNLSLTELEKKLDTTVFVKIHQSYVVNIKKLDTINIITNTINIRGAELPIGRTFKKAFLNRLDCF